MKSNYRYHIKIEDEYGQIIFDRKSNSAKHLIRLYKKAAYSSTGSMYSEFYFGKSLADAPSDVAEAARHE